MGLFSKNRIKKQQQEKEELLSRLDGRELHYVVRRNKGNGPAEQVLGKGGRIMTASGQLRLMAGDVEVFVNDHPETVDCGELMSLNGVMFQGYNQLLDREDTVICYYAYYRK